MDSVPLHTRDVEPASTSGPERRSEPSAASSAPPRPDPPHVRSTILFLAANPSSSARIALDEEARDIEEKIRASGRREALTFKTRWAVRPDDLQQALLDERPSIVHFSGHGSGEAGIVLHGSQDEQQAVSAEALKHLFTVLRDNVRIVILNACHTELQARAIVDVIDVVIGMSHRVGDKAARVFSAAFYRAIGFGRDVRSAFDIGISAIKLEGIVGDGDIPVLLERPGADASTLVLVRTAEARRPASSTSRYLLAGTVVTLVGIAFVLGRCTKSSSVLDLDDCRDSLSRLATYARLPEATIETLQAAIDVHIQHCAPVMQGRDD